MRQELLQQIALEPYPDSTLRRKRVQVQQSAGLPLGAAVSPPQIRAPNRRKKSAWPPGAQALQGVRVSPARTLAQAGAPLAQGLAGR